MLCYVHTVAGGEKNPSIFYWPREEKEDESDVQQEEKKEKTGPLLYKKTYRGLESLSLRHTTSVTFFTDQKKFNSPRATTYQW
jgi:hypothetical protein